MANLKRRSFIAALGAAAPFALPLLAKPQLLDSNSTFKQTFDDPLNSHSIATTDLNTATATAIISLRGLGIACFGPNGYESGFIPNRDHEYMLIIKEIGPGARRLVRAPHRVTGDIRIEVDNPVRRGIFRYENGEFTRPNGSTDERHFKWILDIEGEKMHETKLPLRRLTAPGVPRMSKVFISHGTFYTKALGNYVYARVDSRKHEQEVGVLLGRVAQEIGAAIECKADAGSGLRLVFSTEPPLPLPRIEGLKYEINLQNLRPDHATHYGSDFPLYYRVLRDPQDRQFNLAHVGVTRTDKKIAPDLYRRGCCGLACDKLFLSRSSSLSQPTSA